MHFLAVIGSGVMSGQEVCFSLFVTLAGLSVLLVMDCGNGRRGD
jgi:uncharacterized membrane protein